MFSLSEHETKSKIQGRYMNGYHYSLYIWIIVIKFSKRKHPLTKIRTEVTIYDKEHTLKWKQAPFMVVKHQKRLHQNNKKILGHTFN